LHQWLSIIVFRENTNGETRDLIQGIGRTTQLMALEFIFGLMGGSMRENIKMIRSTGLGSIAGQMVVPILVGGTKASNMA